MKPQKSNPIIFPVSKFLNFLIKAISMGSTVSYLLAMAFVLMVPVYGQISNPCTLSVLSSFTPCMNFITNSTTNGTSPTSDCCNSLKSLTSGGLDCFCLIVTASVPIQIPMAISLPRACNLAGVPLQCKVAASPLPAPGPVAFSPPASSPTSSALAPESGTTPLLPPQSPTMDTESPARSRPVLNPTSTAVLSYSISPTVLLLALGFAVMKYF